MVEFSAAISKFEEYGDKTGWTYIEIGVDIASQIKPGNKKAFKVKGFLDKYKIAGKTVLPMGGGRFILPLDATIRKSIHKGKGAMVLVKLEEDSTPHVIPGWMIECLEDEPLAGERFYKMPRSHQNYYIKWVESAKTEATRTKRMALTINSLVRGLDFGQMIRMNREEKLF
jgi:hypothetical protein